MVWRQDIVLEKDYKYYLKYFLNYFIDIKNLSIEDVVDRSDINIYISRVKSINLNSYSSELGIKLDEDTISFFGDFIPDIYVDEFDNTWEKYDKEGILQILDKYARLFLDVIKYGCYIEFYKDDKICDVETKIIKNNDFNKFIEEQKGKNNISKIKFYNFYGNVIYEYNAKTKSN